METQQVRISKPIYKTLRDMAKTRGMMLSVFIDKILARYVRKQTEKK